MSFLKDIFCLKLTFTDNLSRDQNTYNQEKGDSNEITVNVFFPFLRKM